MINLSRSFHFTLSCHITVLQPQYCRNNIGLGFSRFARHYFGNHFCFLLLWVLRCFSSPRSPPTISGMIQSSRIGLPHSEICGSIRICQSPQLIAAYHVLHRLPEPRHPPCALMYFIFYICAVSYRYLLKINTWQQGLINTLAFIYNFTLSILLFLLLFHHVKDRFNLIGIKSIAV